MWKASVNEMETQLLTRYLLWGPDIKYFFSIKWYWETSLKNAVLRSTSIEKIPGLLPSASTFQPYL